MPDHSCSSPLLMLSLAAKLWFVEATQAFVRHTAKTGVKTAVTPGSVVMGGDVGIQTQKNHVMEAGQSVTSTADRVPERGWGLTGKFSRVRCEVFCEPTNGFRTSPEETERKSRPKGQKTCAECQRHWDTDSEDEDGCDEDEDFYDQDGYGEDEESESDQETEEGESRWMGRKRRRTSHQQKHAQCHGCGRDLKTFSSSSTVVLRAGLLNVQSMNNKRPAVLDVITRDALDVLCTTETWLEKHSGHRVLRDASPKNFSFHHQARAGRGGGVAIQFLSALKHRAFGLSCTITTFEAVASALQLDLWDEPVLFLTIYRPPGSGASEFHTFLDQFEELLRRASEQYSSIVVAGDFNIRVDAENRSYTDEFLWLLPVYELEQHVREPTHEAGHALDLVLTRNVDVSCLDVRDDRISDHFTVYFNIRPRDAESNDNGPAKRFRST